MAASARAITSSSVAFFKPIRLLMSFNARLRSLWAGAIFEISSTSLKIDARVIGSSLTQAFSDSFFFAQRAVTAFLAMAERCSGDTFSIRLLAPALPPFAPCLRKYSMTSSGSFFFGTEKYYTGFSTNSLDTSGGLVYILLQGV